MDRPLSWLTRRQFVQFLAGFAIAGERGIQMTAVLFLVERRKQRAQGLRDASNDSEIQVAAASQLLAADVDLHNARFLRIELLIREVRSEHQQRLAVHHGVVAGGETEQAGHAHIEGIVVLDELLAAHGVDDGSLEHAGQLNQLIMGARAAGSGQDGDFLRAVQLRCEAVQHLLAGNQLRLGAGEGRAAGCIHRIGERHIAGHHHHGNASL